MTGGMVFGMVVAKILGSGAPVDNELALPDAVFEPIEAHVDGFRALLLDGVVCKTCGGGVVCLDGCGGLRVSKFFECDA